ncbi:MAG: hypothetical protein WCR29_02420 [Bacteroidales bacterium]|nr:hypothetical protein [Bacteroidales bacterium]
MNTFQENLQKAISEIIKVSEIIVSSDKASQLDIDILLEKLRKAYDVAISFEIVKEEFLFQSPIIINEEEEEQYNEEAFFEQECIEEKVKEEVVPEVIPEIVKDIVINKEEKVEVEEEKNGKDDEAIINEKIEEIKVEVKEIEREIVEEKVEQLDQRPIVKQNIIEPEILFDTEIIVDTIVNHEQIIEDRQIETPSVLKYLNEQMPKKKDESQIFEKKEIELTLNKPIVQPIEEKIKIPIEEELLEEKPIIIKNQNTTTIGERYTQSNSFFDNISSSVNKSDISSRFKSNNFDFRTAIGVNEKFMFINDLFSGNLREYTEFIQNLNEADSLENAKQILNKTKEAKRWIANSLPYTTLQEIMIKKFH